LQERGNQEIRRNKKQETDVIKRASPVLSWKSKGVRTAKAQGGAGGCSWNSGDIAGGKKTEEKRQRTLLAVQRLEGKGLAQGSQERGKNT